MTVELSESYRYCRKLARLKAKNFYYAFVFLPRAKRNAIYALYAFCQYGDSLADEADDVKNLESLRRGLENCLVGKYDNPFFPALADSIKRFNMPLKYFYELIDGMESDLNFQEFASFEQLQKYCYKVASTVGLLCIEIFGYRDMKVRDYAYNLGIALQLTNIIRDFGEDFKNGRMYFPLDALNSWGFSGNKVFSEEKTEFQRMMEEMFLKAKSFYELANANLRQSELKNQIASEIMKEIYFHLLHKIHRQHFPVLKKRISLSALNKISIALKTYIKIKTA